MGPMWSINNLRANLGPVSAQQSSVRRQLRSKALDSFSDFEANREPATSSNTIYALVSISKTQQRGTSEEVSLMKNILLMTLFMLATLAWAAAQQFDSAPERNSGQAASRVPRRRAQLKLNHRLPAALTRPAGARHGI